MSKEHLSETFVAVVQLLPCVALSLTPWNVAHQVPPAVGFSRREYWSELPFPSPVGNLRMPNGKVSGPNQF